MCVKAAKALTDLLPNLMDSVVLYQTGPWWTLVYSLMKALTVLLLKMSYGTVYLQEDSEQILLSVKKLIRWLRAIKESDQIAKRAYTLAFGILRKLAPRIKADISNLLKEDVACSKDDTRTSAEIHSPISERTQGSIGVGEHRFGQRRPASRYYGFHTGHASTSAHPSVPPHAYMRPDHASSADIAHAHPLFKPSFSTPYDEDNRVYPMNVFSNIDTAMPDAIDENLS